jgi:nitroimidazol reductase NimA-like FMN-containing flavoprotein (pyridoxamine 5'-phosphate oxidase superfamily)
MFDCKASPISAAPMSIHVNPWRMAMSAPNLRRTDMAMTDEEMLQALERGFVGRLATVNEDGSPYCVPLLYVWANNLVFLHGTSAPGHLQTNIRREPRVCFELDEPDQVFDYGRFECDSGLAYRSVILFGRIQIAEDTATKQRFCERLMEKYGKPNTIRPKNFFPRLDVITVYAMTVARMTGKHRSLPELSEQWPAKDRTKTPSARP